MELHLDAGTLTLNRTDRTVTGLLVPYGEEARSSIGKFSVDAGVFTIPGDLTGMSLNVEHAREGIVGAFTETHETDAGIVSTFRIADGEAGDAAIADIEAGTRKHLSAEVAGVVIKAGKAIAGRLFAAALVAAPAFPSATLLASAPDTVTVDDLDERIQIAVAQAIAALKTAEEEQASTEQTPETPAEGGTLVATATIPEILETSSEASPTKAGVGLYEFSTLLASVHRTNDKSLLSALDEEGATLFAALSDIKSNYAGSVGVDIIQPAYIGQLWEGRARQRKIIPLIDNKPLTSLKLVGWKWGTKPAVAAWAGDKSNVSSNSPTTDDYSLTALRYAGAHDIAREFVDFSVSEFWTEYLRAMTESYSEVTDDAALAALVAGATAVTPGTVPAGVNAATAALVDGALAVAAVDAPSFAIVAPDVYRSLLLQGKDDLIGTLSLSLGLETGDLAGFKIVSSTGVAAGKVLVGAKPAATSYELPGSPIRVDAQDLSRGGVDTGFFGYHVTGINNATGLALVTLA